MRERGVKQLRLNHTSELSFWPAKGRPECIVTPLDSGFRRAATGVLGSLFLTLLYHLRPVGVPSRRIQDFLSINDDEVLFWLFVILSASSMQGFSRNAESPHLK